MGISCALIASVLYLFRSRPDFKVWALRSISFVAMPLISFAALLMLPAGSQGSLAIEGLVVGVVDGMLLALILVLPLTIGRYLGSNIAGIAASAISILIAYTLCLLIFAPENLLGGLAAAGVSLLVLFSHRYIVFVLLYPLLLVWNFLLWRVAINESSRAVSLLTFNSYIWNHHQPWPTPEFGDHLALAFQKDRATSDDQKILERLSVPIRDKALVNTIWHELGQVDCFDTLVEAGHHVYARKVASALPLELQWLLLTARQCAEVKRQASFAARTGFLRLQMQEVSNYAQHLKADSLSGRRMARIVETWYSVLSDEIDAFKVAKREALEIENPYVVGVPVLANSRLFVGRRDISAKIESIIFAERRTPILIHGQRRIGKTSLLKSLPFLLPDSILPLFVDFQGPVSSAQNESEFCNEVITALARSGEQHRSLELSCINEHLDASNPLLRMSRWFDELQSLAAAAGKQTILVAFDEVESLLHAFESKRLEQETIMGFFRHLIQHRDSLKLIFASARDARELSGLASSLINLEAVRLSCLERDETIALITQPVPGFNLEYDVSALNCVVDVSSGHPALLQLMCSSIVDLKNRQPRIQRDLVQLGDVQLAIESTLEQGALFFFQDLSSRHLDGKIAFMLERIATCGPMTPDRLTNEFTGKREHVEALLRWLCRRDVLSCEDNRYRFRVELVRMWFERQATEIPA